MGKAKLYEAENPAQLTILTWSLNFHLARIAVENLSKEGIYADILDLRTLKPVDSEAIFKAAQKTHRLLILQEGTPVASYGSWLSHHIQEIAFDELDAPVSLVSADDVPMPYTFSLEPKVLPNIDKVINAAKTLVG